MFSKEPVKSQYPFSTEQVIRGDVKLEWRRSLYLYQPQVQLLFRSWAVGVLLKDTLIQAVMHWAKLGDSNVCPCITGLFSALWEKSALIKKLPENFSRFHILCQRARVITDQIKTGLWVVSILCHWNERLFHSGKRETYISHHGYSVPECLVNQYHMSAVHCCKDGRNSEIKILSNLALLALTCSKSSDREVEWGLCFSTVTQHSVKQDNTCAQGVLFTIWSIVSGWAARVQTSDSLPPAAGLISLWETGCLGWQECVMSKCFHV